jgi:hypothetical protein
LAPCSPSPVHAAEVLDQRFKRDMQADWKVELVRRREALKVCAFVHVVWNGLSGRYKVSSLAQNTRNARWPGIPYLS